TCSLPKIRGPASSSSTACSFLPTRPGWVSEKRYLILAEGRSRDPHYGKTARGVIRYAPDPAVAVVDSTRPGESLDGVPVFPTGQTGIAIAGWGIAVDAVVSDFLAGAAELLVVEGQRRGGELLFVEGQGSLVHPAYSGVTLGLIHGSAPHAFVLCHRAGATEIEGYPGAPLPSLSELVELHERIALPRRRACVACLALNTAHLSEEQARTAIAAAAEETGLPADDPVRFGGGPLLEAAAKANRVVGQQAGLL